MKKIHKHIEIVISTIDGIHSLTLSSAEAIRHVLVKRYDLVGITILNSQKDLDDLVSENPDLVFIGMKRLPVGGENHVSISSYLEGKGIQVTGSSSTAIELERDKPKAKDMITSAGLASPNYVRTDLTSMYDASLAALSFPMFIKPIDRGAGAGIDENSVVRNRTDLTAKIDSLSERNFTSAMAEEYLSGKEYSVALLEEIGSGKTNVMPLELIAPKNTKGDRILSSDVKNEDTEKSILVPPGEIRDKLVALALGAFKALGARDYGRIDMRFDNVGNLQFIEANLLPSLSDSPGNYFPKACLLNEGLDYDSIIFRIANLVSSRSQNSEYDVNTKTAIQSLPLASS